MQKLILIWLFLGALAACGSPTPGQIEQTAVVLGCYPYGYFQQPTATELPRATPGPGTATATATSLPAPTWAACTPAPAVPTLTASPQPSSTPWTRPTQQPPLTGNTIPINISNQPGYDVEPAIALHPTEGWAAVVWANWVWEFPDEATVYVKVQGKSSQTWNPAIGVNTGAVSKGAGSPAIVIDRSGGIHVVFLSAEGRRHPVYTFSSDHGATWSDPAPIPQPGDADGMYYPQLWIDQADTLHLIYTATSCFDCFRYIHAEKPLQREGWSTQDQLVPGRKQLFGDITSVELPGGAIRTLAAIGCREGCPHGPGVEIAYRDGAGPWINRGIPNQNLRVTPQVVQWVDLIGFTAASGQGYICVAWGQYSRSAVHSACSTDTGATWDEPTIIAYHAEATGPSGEPTPVGGPTPAAATPDPAGQGDSDSPANSDRGYHPSLLYVKEANRLLAIWTLRERTAANSSTPYYTVYSYRDLDSDVWWPLIDGAAQEPPLRLFAATRRSAARNPVLAYAGSGPAMAAWIEIERDESIEVYVGIFDPAALVIGGR
jgi:hypothetical protein